MSQWLCRSDVPGKRKILFLFCFYAKAPRTHTLLAWATFISPPSFSLYFIFQVNVCPNNCTNHGTCSVVQPDNTKGGAGRTERRCVCENGWKGSGCEELDECGRTSLQGACSGHGDCVDDGTTSFAYCRCSSNDWEGSLCETYLPHQCPTGPTNETCSSPSHGVCVTEQTDTCTTPPCCQCVQGWYGEACESAVACFNGCSGHGTCTNAVCACEEGYEGFSCQDRTACPVGVDGKECGVHGTCDRGICRCEKGYQGESCVEISPCKNGCNGRQQGEVSEREEKRRGEEREIFLFIFSFVWKSTFDLKQSSNLFFFCCSSFFSFHLRYTVRQWHLPVSSRLGR